ncbi:MAG: hypothetical protein L0H64_16710 [Pseudonocardia sp.]|nr:hypothetical protein [Pseudonocardia sp.]
MEGALVGGELSLTGDGATVTGTVTAADVLGTATVGDRYWPYAAATAVPPSGLYEGRADVRGAVARIGGSCCPTAPR